MDISEAYMSYAHMTVSNKSDWTSVLKGRQIPSQSDLQRLAYIIKRLICSKGKENNVSLFKIHTFRKNVDTHQEMK